MKKNLISQDKKENTASKIHGIGGRRIVLGPNYLKNCIQCKWTKHSKYNKISKTFSVNKKIKYIKNKINK